jgi:hypothetical protein
MRKFWLILIALLAAFALAFAACGGDDDDSGGSDATRTATTQATDDSGGGDDDDDDASPTETDDSGDDGGGDDDDGGIGEATSEEDLGFAVCSLLTEEEVGAAINDDTVEPGEENSFAPFYDCSWFTETFNSVSLSVAERDIGESLYNLDLDEETDPEDVDIGDEAHFLSGILPLLEVLDGDWYFSISVNGQGPDGEDLSDDEVRASSIELAEQVIDRLP